MICTVSYSPCQCPLLFHTSTSEKCFFAGHFDSWMCQFTNKKFPLISTVYKYNSASLVPYTKQTERDWPWFLKQCLASPFSRWPSFNACPAPSVHCPMILCTLLARGPGWRLSPLSAWPACKDSPKAMPWLPPASCSLPGPPSCPYGCASPRQTGSV